ncbi:amidase [Limnohabitans sp. Jir61]|uniref:amidase n=1 Tax=Limnohabitans sp. Jir61 TaxID=1826168 RepID=UPI000D3948A3|nr:amidase [Limnohabitans sp. Jir61]PUE32872.1 amidase [Limnohabitans sp. Jir61]
MTQACFDNSTTATERVASALDNAASPAAQHVFTQLYADAARVTSQHSDAQAQAGRSLGALHGVCITIKDNIDVAGETTMAGGVVCAGEAPALHDAPVLQRLRHSGAVVLGKTNMSEFAFSGLGINPHHGTPANPADTTHARVPGGSSSGAAVSVALGLAEVGIGTDTGGSIRIPAALCGLVGYKSTQARIPCTGVMELSRTLDTVGSITRSVRACLAVDAVLSQQALPTDATDLRGLRFAVPQTLMMDDVDATVAQAFARTLRRISEAGAQVVEIPFTALGDIAALSMPGGFSPIESFAAHHARLERGANQIDHRVVARMMLGKGISAQDYLELHNRRHAWISAAQQTLQGFDAMLCPTVPMVSPLIEPLLKDDEAFFKVNRLLLRNPSTINYMDGCAWSLPCHEAGELPVGLMVSSVAGQDAHLARVALALENLINSLHA